MRDHWCGCHRCGGDRWVVKSTYILHNPGGGNLRRRYIRQGQQSPSPGPASSDPMDLDDTEHLDVSDQEDDGNRAARSDSVGVLRYLIHLLCPLSVFRTG